MLALGFDEKHFIAEAFPGMGNLDLFFIYFFSQPILTIHKENRLATP